MKNMQERNLKLMKEMDDNYKMIEEEAQDHFRDFLEKWKGLAKDKIDRYKAAFTTLKSDKEDIQTRLQAVVHGIQERNQKLIDDYGKLLEKYRDDIDAQKRQHKDKIELVETTYDDELTKLKQEKIELEGLLEAMKSQKDVYEQKTKELKGKMKEKEMTKREQVQAIVGTYAGDCCALVVESIICKIEDKENKAKAEELNKAQNSLIEALKRNINAMEKEHEDLKGMHQSEIAELSKSVNKIQKEKETLQTEYVSKKETVVAPIHLEEGNIKKEDQKRSNDDDIVLENIKLKAEIKQLRTGIFEGKEDEAEQLRKENAKLQDRLVLFKAQTMAGRLPEEQKKEDFYKQEYEKVLAENQEFQVQIQSLDNYKSQVIELGVKLQKREKDFGDLREKYEKVGLERVMLGKQVLKYKQVETERAKIRESIANNEGEVDSAGKK